MHLDDTLKRQIYGGQVPGLDFLAYVDTDAQDDWVVGDTVVLPDGREFRHCKSTGAAIMYPNVGCNFTDTGFMAYTAFGVSASVGAREITLPAATHAAVAKDALAGGYLVIFNGSGTNDVTVGITGNDASLADVAFKVKLDMGVPVAIVAATSAVEAYVNPWSVIAQANTTVLPRCGAPVVAVSAAANYFWLQTKGVKFVNPQALVGGDNGGIMAMWRHDGTIENCEDALGITVDANNTCQPAGIVVSGSSAGNGPLINLTGY
jgi:hypothetical protein